MYLNIFFQADDHLMSVELSPVDLEVIQTLRQIDPFSTQLIFGGLREERESVITMAGMAEAAQSLIDIIGDPSNQMNCHFVFCQPDSSGTNTTETKTIRGLRYHGLAVWLEAGVGRCQLLRLIEQPDGELFPELLQDLRGHSQFQHDDGTVEIHSRQITLPLLESMKQIHEFALICPDHNVSIDIPASRVLQQTDPDIG